MIDTYSPFGCPSEFFNYPKNENVKLVIDPNPSYFEKNLETDYINYEKLFLIQGMEPKELNDVSKLIIKNKSKFYKILTSFNDVLENCENSVLFLYASCWILTDKNKNKINLKKDYHNIFSTDKKFTVSSVMSGKNFLPGHRLRHETLELIKKQRTFELYFPNSIPLDEKYKLFESSMFHIAIENTKNHNYISEKIIDCFMSYTIPIYWGCPNLSEYFNTDGIIFFNTAEELDNILNNLNKNDYLSRINAVEENYKIAHNNYAFWYDRVNDELKNEF